MTAQEKLLTVAEFEKLPNDGKKYDLVRGELVEVCRPTGVHGEIQLLIGHYFLTYLEKNRIGRATAESGYKLSENTVLGPDVAFISFERIQKFAAVGMIPVAPDLAVEIVSPNDTAQQIEDKVQLYMEAGTRLIWVIYPGAKAVHIFSPDGEPHVAGIDDTLDGEDIMPDFRLVLRDLFNALNEKE